MSRDISTPSRRPFAAPRTLIAALLLAAWFLAAPVSVHAAGIPVHGQVVDPDGLPLAGVRIELLPMVPDLELALAELAAVEAGAGGTDGDAATAAGAAGADPGRPFPAPVDSARTSGDGRFRLEAPGPGMWTLEASAPGRVAQTTVVGPLDGEAAVLAPLRLPEATDLEVRVVGADGAPVAGARVGIVSENAMLLFGRDQLPRARLARTGENGTATLPRGRSEVVTLTVVAPGHGPVVRREVRTPSATARLAASRPRPVEVRDAAGEPVPGAVVRIGELPVGLTGEDGRWTAVAPPAGAEAVPLSALAPGGRQAEGTLEPVPAAPATAAAAGAGPPPLDPAVLTLPPLVRITGRAVDPDREGVAGAFVWFSGGRAQAERTGQRGEFDLEIPAPTARQRRWVGADADGYGAAYHEVTDDPGAGAEPVTLLLKPTQALAGRVVDEAGDPVEGASLHARDPQRRRLLSPGGEYALSGADGAFRLAELEPETAFVVQVRSPGYAPAQVEASTPPAGGVREPLEIVLQPGLEVFGRVVDLDETPVVGAEVALVPSPGSGDMRSLMLAARQQGTDVPRTRSGPGGRFDLSDLAIGRYDLEVLAPGFAPLVIPGLALERGRGARDLGTVLLEPGAVLEGRVVDDAGDPVPEAQVVVRSETGMTARWRRRPGEEGPSTTTAADGHFRIEDLAPGQRVELMAHRDGYTSADLPGVEVPPEEPLVVTLAPASTVAGVVVDGRDEPVAGARITVVSQSPGAGGSFQQAFTGGVSDEEGRFRVDGARPGELTVAVSARGFMPLERTGLRIARGESLEDLRLVVETGARIEGRVLDPLGRPLPEASVQWLQESRRPGMGGAFDRTDADGRFVLEGVPPGHHSFEADHREHLRAVRDLEVLPGTNTLELRLEAGASVAGRVVGEGGAAVAGARVTVQSVEGRRGFGRPDRNTGEDGSFEIAGLEPGTYSLRADKGGFAAATLDAVEVGRVPVTGLELRLERGAVITGRLLGVELPDLAAASVLANPPGRGPLGNVGVVDFDGGYRIEGLAAGEWLVVASLGEGKAAAMERVTLEPGQREAVVDLDLGSGYTLTGRVLMGEEPAVNLMITVVGEERTGGGYTRTDHQGAFRIPNLQPGTYRLATQGFGMAGNHEETLEISGDQDVEVRIPVGSVAGRVTAAGEGPVEGAELQLEAVEGERAGFILPLRSGADGAFQLGPVPAGTYRVRASKAGYVQAERVVEVREGEPVSGVELQLEPAGGLTLQVTSATGRPPERVRVAGYDPGGWAPGPGGSPEPRTVFSDSLSTGEGGRVHVDQAPAGTWRVLVVAEGTAVTEVVATAPGPPVPVVLQLGSVLTVVVDDLLATAPAARVRLTGTDGRPFVHLDWQGRPATTTDLTFGQGRILNLPAGTWTVEATTDDGRRWTATATTTPGAVTEVVLE